MSVPGLDVHLLPRKWERIGDVLILRFPPEVSPWREVLAPIYAHALGAKTVVEDLARIRGPWRVPDVRWLWGDGTETVHLENGVRFKLDVTKVMFSSGNLAERVWMSRLPREGETVVDLFAGIGYFSVPMAVHARPAKIVACEVNPTAFRYLEENIRINRAACVEPRLGDCREVAPGGIADRVVMGHFDARGFLDVAFRAAQDRATIHVHGLIGPPGRAPAFQTDLEQEALRNGFEVIDHRVRRIKWYGPRERHAVVDLRVRRVSARPI